TVEYSLSEQEKLLKNELKQNLDNLKQDIAESVEKKNKIEINIEELEKVVYVDEIKQNFNAAQQRISRLIESLNELRKLWDKQDYYQLNEKFNDVNKESIQINESIKKIEENVSYSLLLHNELASKLNETKQKLTELNQSLILDEDIAAEINKNINNFNSVLILFNSKQDISKKIIQVESLYNSVYILYGTINDYEKREVLKKNIEVDINYEILCNLNKSCVERPSITERANQTEFNLKEACDDIEYLKINYLNISANNSNNETINTVKQDTAQKYLNQLPEQGDNFEIIEEILLSYGNDSINQEYSLDNLFLQLVKDQPESCKKLNLSYNLMINEEIKIIKEKEAMPVEINIEFNEHSLKCCVFKECEPCCTTKKCINDPSKFPIVFVHGHSVNKNTAADHSLDVFNKLQKELEKDGYLNAGSITLYASDDASPGAWGLMQTPVSIKASYYFDVFQEPENYLVVQIKSENIDTYAVRMQEIINSVKHRTGKPKVILIAHSMGGLVSRRYLQIFGEDDVEKLIMIGTPNQGIEGDIAHMCPIIGSRYACRDMLADSLFMNKLNSGNLPDIETYMIIGDGCELDGQPSDGTVLVKNARLEGEKVRNFVVNGTCEGIKKLHSKMLDPKIHPEVYDIIITALRE
ncbi:MAG: alpha/beta fold hydrolase, partial [Candidatus Nanoarchaeia archaeon]|nr:alpha/beta fold hydrolase [Candidatus Nanoarchaeia archaeon]